MASDFDLQVAVAETMQEMLGGLIRQRQASESAVSPSGTVYGEAIRDALPWQAVSGAINGSASVGSNILRWPFPQGGVIRSVGIDARTAPTGSPFAIAVTGGVSNDSFSLQPGNSSAVSPALIRVTAGSWIRIAVTSTGSAADVQICLHYTTGGA